jgi:hypothetical protein
MMPDEKWLEILREAHAEPLDAAHYTAVRARVLAEIGQSRQPWRRLAWISGIGALAAALLLAVASRRPELPPLHAVAARIPAAPAAPVARVRTAPKTAPAIAAARVNREPLTIKIQTSDPNIVIYWIAD